MAPTQRIKVANEKASKNITLRGNVPKSTVRKSGKIVFIANMPGSWLSHKKAQRKACNNCTRNLRAHKVTFIDGNNQQRVVC